jgi:hypothetical protein
MLVGLATGATQAGDLNMKATLIWGCDEEQKPADAKIKAVSPELAKRLKGIFKWKQYFEVKPETAQILDKATKDFVLSYKCTVKVRNVGGKAYNAKLLGEGKQLKAIDQLSVKQGEDLVLAGDDKNMTEWFDTFKDVKLGFSRVWVKNETLVLEWVINGKHHGQLFGVKGTEQPIGHYGLSIVTMSPDGKVASEHRYGELGTVMTQVGAAGTKAKPRPIPPIPEKPETTLATGTPEEEKNVEVAKSV